MEEAYCLAAISAPLLISCSKREESAATDQPARITVVAPIPSCQGSESSPAAEDMQANKDALDAL